MSSTFSSFITWWERQWSALYLEFFSKASSKHKTTFVVRWQRYNIPNSSRPRDKLKQVWRVCLSTSLTKFRWISNLHVILLSGASSFLWQASSLLGSYNLRRRCHFQFVLRLAPLFATRRLYKHGHGFAVYPVRLCRRSMLKMKWCKNSTYAAAAPQENVNQLGCNFDYSYSLQYNLVCKLKFTSQILRKWINELKFCKRNHC